ncbi:MAG TPA: hypothetical protein VFQ78_10870 [Candidatus Udaeobacter sp.]|nr:hypothetical protein [Candidatus Udaeobacter sp.]
MKPFVMWEGPQRPDRAEHNSPYNPHNLKSHARLASENFWEALAPRVLISAPPRNAYGKFAMGAITSTRTLALPYRSAATFLFAGSGWRATIRLP